MKILSTALAVAVATAAFGLPVSGFAQGMQDQGSHQPMPGNPTHPGGMSGGTMNQGNMNQGNMNQGDARGDMHQGDTRNGNMHRDNMGPGDMHHDDMRGMGHHGGHRHCGTKWRHHHRVRVCR